MPGEYNGEMFCLQGGTEEFGVRGWAVAETRRSRGAQET